MYFFHIKIPKNIYRTFTIWPLCTLINFFMSSFPYSPKNEKSNPIQVTLNKRCALIVKRLEHKF